MNILLSLKKFSHIGYYIHEARTKAKERKKHHRDRLNLSNDQIKYLDKVVIPEGCSYQVNDHTFSSIDKALAYCKRLSIPFPCSFVFCGQSFQITRSPWLLSHISMPLPKTSARIS